LYSKTTTERGGHGRKKGGTEGSGGTLNKNSEHGRKRKILGGKLRWAEGSFEEGRKTAKQ